jgi:hypothetical protein
VEALAVAGALTMMLLVRLRPSCGTGATSPYREPGAAWSRGLKGVVGAKMYFAKKVTRLLDNNRSFSV